MRARSGKRVLFGAAGAAAALVIALVLLARGGPSPGERARSAQTSVAVPAPRTPAIGGDDPTPPEGVFVIEADVGVPDRAVYLAKARETMALYLESAVYPPWSRPADGSQGHLVDWNHELAVVEEITRVDDEPIYAELTLDRMFAGPGETVTATMTTWRGEGNRGEPVELDVSGQLRVWDEAAARKDSSATGWNPRGWVSVADVAFTRPPGTPAGQQVASFTPSQTEALAGAPKDLMLLAHVHAAGHGKPLSIILRYASKPPLVVLNKVGDRLVDGNLEVELLVDVRRAGPTLVQATLFDSDGVTPIAVYDRHAAIAGPGVQTITLEFFGRAIRQHGVDGPYAVGSLHGFVMEQDLEVFWKHDSLLPTRRYRAGDFSDDEWNGAEKLAKVQHYEQWIEGIKRGDM